VRSAGAARAAGEKAFHWRAAITINCYYLGLTALWQTLTPLLVPLLVQQFVGEARKGSYFGLLRLGTLMLAVLVQALMGMLSDRSTLRWGRRRPFIFAGTLADQVFLAAIGYSAGMSGMAGYWFLFGAVMLLSISSNTAQGAQQGLIPDLVPEGQRGRFSGVKALFEVPLPMILVAFTSAKLIGAGQYWASLLLAGFLLLVTMALTMRVREEPLRAAPAPLDWPPFVRLLGMTAVFTAVIVGMGEAVSVVGQALGATTSVAVLLLGMGFAGLVAMIVAVLVGVWASIRISLGAEAARGNRAFSWWVMSRLAFLIGVSNLGSFAVYFLQARLGLVHEQAAGPASLLIAAIGATILVSALPSGWLADRLGPRRLVAASGLLAALGTAIAVAARGSLGIYAGGVCIGLATGMFYPASWALGTEIVPQAEAGRYLGIANLAGAGAGAIGAYIGGPLADYFTLRAPGSPGLGYLLIFVLYALLFVFSTLALRGARTSQ